MSLRDRGDPRLARRDTRSSWGCPPLIARMPRARNNQGVACQSTPDEQEHLSAACQQPVFSPRGGAECGEIFLYVRVLRLALLSSTKSGPFAPVGTARIRKHVRAGVLTPYI